MTDNKPRLGYMSDKAKETREQLFQHLSVIPNSLLNVINYTPERAFKGGFDSGYEEAQQEWVGATKQMQKDFQTALEALREIVSIQGRFVQSAIEEDEWFGYMGSAAQPTKIAYTALKKLGEGDG